MIFHCFEFEKIVTYKLKNLCVGNLETEHTKHVLFTKLIYLFYSPRTMQSKLADERVYFQWSRTRQTQDFPYPTFP